MKGKLIVIEGLDGSGKTTQTKILKDFFDSKGIPNESFHYPDYSGPIGKLIKEYLAENQELSTEIQFLLYATDMVKDKEKIVSLLNKGYNVICDRFFTATMAYQCMVKDFPIKRALSFAELFDMPKPDRIIYLRIRPEICAERKNELDRHEKNIDFNRTLSDLFERLIQEQTWSSWFPVDGEKTKEEVFEQIKKILMV